MTTSISLKFLLTDFIGSIIGPIVAPKVLWSVTPSMFKAAIPVGAVIAIFIFLL